MTLYAILLLLLTAALAVLLFPAWRSDALARRQKIFFIATVSAVFSGGALGLYHLLGSPGIVPALEEYHADRRRLENSITAEAAILAATPDNLEAWVRLGQHLMEARQFEKASGALKRAVTLSHGDPRLILAYANAMIAAADGTVTDDAKKSLEMALLQEPENPQARYFMAVRLLQEGKQEEAMRAMKALYRSLPDDSPLKATINRQIGRQ